MYKHITKEGKDFDELALILSEDNVKEVFCDIESTGLDARLSSLLLFQVMTGDQIFIYDFLHLNREHLKYLINLLEFTKVKCVFHNTKFDIKFIYENSGIWMKNLFDTMYCEVLLNAGIGKALYSLDELTEKYTTLVLDKEVRKEFINHGEVKEFSAQMLNYSAMDVLALKGIYEQQLLRIKEAREEKVLQVEMDLLTVVAKMEHDGILLDQDKWLLLEDKAKAIAEFNKIQITDELFSKFGSFENALKLADTLKIPVKTKRDRSALESILDQKLSYDWARGKFNIDSHQQLRLALNLIGIPVTSVDKKVLKNFKEHEIIQKLLEYSENEKRVSTYGRNLLKLIHPITGRIHADFFNIGAATGRFSSGHPNMQNIPNAEGYKQCFISSPEYYFLTLDYSQQEYRLAGAVSNEQRIIDAYLAGSDMHTATGAIVFNKKLSDVTKEERYIGKTMNFAILYGSTEWGLKRNLGVSLDRAVELLKSFWDGYPTLHKFKNSVEEKIVELGYSITPLGRRRYNTEKSIYMNNNEYFQYNSRIKREGFNHVIQGGGADILKIAMVNIHNKNPFGDKLRLLIQVHDELDAEAHESVRVDAAEFMKEEMLKAESLFLGPIPSKVDVKCDTTYWAK